MKILILAVTYNSYQELNSYLKSIDKAVELCTETEVTVCIVDNSIDKQSIDASQYKRIQVEVYSLNNKGYLGGAQYVINGCTDILKYDYVAISNVDIEMASDFFVKLREYKFDEDIAWLATRIWSKAEERDRNPKIISRPSKKRLQLVNLMYKYPVLDYLYTRTLYKRKTMYTPSPEMDIYAGHGSFMMLTKAFFEKYPKINYPIFLFGEELFFGELIRQAGMRVRYVPNMEVIDTEHTSTGKMKKAFYYKCNKESIDYILNTFYK